MDNVVISPKFNMEDIRRLRNYNSERHLKMTESERLVETKKATEWFIKEMGKPITVLNGPKI